jgi:hypothetical protein
MAQKWPHRKERENNYEAQSPIKLVLKDDVGTKTDVKKDKKKLMSTQVIILYSWPKSQDQDYRTEKIMKANSQLTQY